MKREAMKMKCYDDSNDCDVDNDDDAKTYSLACVCEDDLQGNILASFLLNLSVIFPLHSFHPVRTLRCRGLESYGRR